MILIILITVHTIVTSVTRWEETDRKRQQRRARWEKMEILGRHFRKVQQQSYYHVWFLCLSPDGPPGGGVGRLVCWFLLWLPPALLPLGTALRCFSSARLVALVNGDVVAVQLSCPWTWVTGVLWCVGYDYGDIDEFDVADDSLIPMVMVADCK